MCECTISSFSVLLSTTSQYIDRYAGLVVAAADNDDKVERQRSLSVYIRLPVWNHGHSRPVSRSNDVVWMANVVFNQWSRYMTCECFKGNHVEINVRIDSVSRCCLIASMSLWWHLFLSVTRLFARFFCLVHTYIYIYIYAYTRTQHLSVHVNRCLDDSERNRGFYLLKKKWEFSASLFWNYVNICKVSFLEALSKC